MMFFNARSTTTSKSCSSSTLNGQKGVSLTDSGLGFMMCIQVHTP